MILTLPDLITPEELVLIKQKLAAVPFADGKATAGELLHAKKQNQQIPWDHPVMKDITNLVMQALGRHDAFMSAAQPRRLAAMLVSRYGPGMAYGSHVDSAVMGAPHHVRSDVSFTLFLSEPDTYEGGELAFEVAGSEVSFKLPARSAICYSTGQLHRVRPVESGERLAVVGWGCASCCTICPRRASCWSARKAWSVRWNWSTSAIPISCDATPSRRTRLSHVGRAPARRHADVRRGR